MKPLIELGTLRAFLSGKISYAYGWSGPSVTIDTACSSSLVSVVTACRALAHYDCTTALAGGVNTITSPDVSIGEPPFKRNEMLIM